jgi:Zn-dependent protease
MRSVNVENQAQSRHTFVSPPKVQRRLFGFSRKEITHLILAGLLVVGVGFTLPYMVYTDYTMLALLSTAFAGSFLVHEIGHKMMAQRYGLWAEFRLTIMGVILTLLSLLPTYFKIIGPGAVTVKGIASTQTIGKTSIIGPTANIMLAAAFCATALLLTYNRVFPLIAFYNVLIAIFNLIPLGVLDGYKVFVWDKKIWALTFTASIALGVITYRLLF